MTPNHVKRKLSAGTPSVGSWLNLGSPISAELIAALGFDWLCVDMEHGQIDLSTMAAMFTAIGRYPVAPLARIPEIKRVRRGTPPPFRTSPRTTGAGKAAARIAAFVRAEDWPVRVP